MGYRQNIANVDKTTEAAELKQALNNFLEKNEVDQLGDSVAQTIHKIADNSNFKDFPGSFTKEGTPQKQHADEFKASVNKARKDIAQVTEQDLDFEAYGKDIMNNYVNAESETEEYFFDKVDDLVNAYDYESISGAIADQELANKDGLPEPEPKKKWWQWG